MELRRTRQRAILEIVEQQPVHSQLEMVEQLEKRGIPATQATVSRDIRALGLVKIPGNGDAHYALPSAAPAPETTAEDLRRVSAYITGVDKGQALCVLRTRSGHANAVAVAIDDCRYPEVVGTIAGDDTILIICRRDKDRQLMMRRFQELLE